MNYLFSDEEQKQVAKLLNIKRTEADKFVTFHHNTDFKNGVGTMAIELASELKQKLDEINELNYQICDNIFGTKHSMLSQSK